MADFNVAEAEVLMLEIVDPDVKKQFEESAKAIKLVPQGKAKFTNSRGVRLVSQVEPNPGMAWFGEGEQYATANTSKKIAMRVFFTRYAIARSLTGDAIDTTSRESLLNALSSGIREDTDTAMKEFNRQFYGTGTGAIATVTSVSGTSVTFGSSGSNTTSYGARKILLRGEYNFINPSTGAIRVGSGTGVSVPSSRTLSTGVVVFDAVASDVAAGDLLVWKNSYNRSIHGLDYHVNNDTGSYQGQSRADYEALRAVVIDAAVSSVNQPLSVALLDRAELESVYRTGSDGSVDDLTIISSPTQVAAYKLLGYNLVRYDGPNAKFDAGLNVTSHNGHPWVVDVDCPNDAIYIIRKNTFGKFEVKPFGIMKEGGQVLRPVHSFNSSAVGGYFDKFIYYIGGKMDVGCYEPFKNIKIKNLDVTNLPQGLL
jgi:hypothetical protein